MKNTGKSLEELSEGLFIYPQLLENVTVKDKDQCLDDSALWDVVKSVEDELGDNGRILVRPSGTEPLVRVMVEAQTDALCEHYVKQVVDYIKEKEY